MKQFSQETRRKMSESAKRRCSNSEWVRAQHLRGVQLPYDEVRDLYAQGFTQREIGERYGVSQKSVWRFMKNNGIKARVAYKRDQRGEKNDYWRGGCVRSEGYIFRVALGHPKAKKCGNYVREHVLVAETALGRLLRDDEVVHHIDGDKSNNSPENLAVMTRAEHSHYHAMVRQNNKIETPKSVKNNL